MVYEELYKARRVPNVANSVAKRCQNVVAGRQEKQRELFWAKRNPMENTPLKKPQPHGARNNARAEMLIKWKMEKLNKLEEEKKKKKPAFKVGVIQRTATGSPLIKNPNGRNDLNTNNILKRIDLSDKVVTRSRAKALLNSAEKQTMYSNKNSYSTECNAGKIKLKNKFCKIDGQVISTLNCYKFKPAKSVSELKFACKLTNPNSPKITKKRINTPLNKPNNFTILKKESLSEIQCEKSSTVTPVIENKSETPQMKVMSLHDPEWDTEKTLSKNMKSPESRQTPEYLLQAIIKKKTVDVECRKSTSEKPLIPEIKYSKAQSPVLKSYSCRSIYHSLSGQTEEEIKNEENEFHCRIFSFRKYVQCVTKRLLDTCDTWKNIMTNSSEIPSDVEGDIYSAIGKTKLLTSDKFVQFQSLIDKCEKKDPLIKLDDLQGFQDWVSIEVEKIDSDFGKLEKIRENNWTSESVTVNFPQVVKGKHHKDLSTNRGGKSNIRTHIEAARRKMKENKGTNQVMNLIDVETPIKNESNLLKKVYLESSDRKKKSLNELTPLSRRNSGLEILVASQKSKFSSSAKKSVSIMNENSNPKNQKDTLSRSTLRKTPHVIKEKLLNRVTFRKSNENSQSKSTRLDEKYFRPAVDNEESPLRLVLGDLNVQNTASRRVTRSRAHLIDIYM